MTSSRPPHHQPFLDLSGWEADDSPADATHFSTQAHFLRNVENHVRENAIHQRRRSRYE
jgi:hypothetical protein